MVRNLVVLGSTGSIGRQTLDVARAFPERIHVFGLAAGRQVDALARQVEEFHPAVAVAAAGGETVLVPPNGIQHGSAAVIDMVSQSAVDLVVVGTSGSAGLLPTLAALRAGKLVALANKETLVMAGEIIQRELASGSGRLVPIDSEHSAIWQCILGEPRLEVEGLTLTASGGALRDLPASKLDTVTPEQALRHPTWSMGQKVTVDSANLFNKGLEAIEARWLFDLAFDRIEIIMHPQSIVHSLVRFSDSSTKAQLGVPDMRLPIQYALSHPERWENALPRLDLAEVGALTFMEVDMVRYPALRCALQAGSLGATYPAALSAADEVAVEAFLQGRIGFTAVPRILQAVLESHTPCQISGLDDILEAERWGRETAKRLALKYVAP